jgi:hypothetical protein
MQRYGIPTSPFEKTSSWQHAVEIIRNGRFGFPVVIKADGLAAGKGVMLPTIAEKQKGHQPDHGPENSWGCWNKSSSRNSWRAKRSHSLSLVTELMLCQWLPLKITRLS